VEEFNYREHYQKDAVEFDYFEQRTKATAHEERRVREYLISKVPTDARSILDVGCGRAWVAENFLKKNVQVYSLDISITNPIKAIKIYPDKNHFGIVADSFTLPFPNESFDCVIASEIIEHVIDPQKFIQELIRVVKKNGSLVISTPYKEKIQYYLCIHCNQVTPVHAHIHSFDETKLESFSVNTNSKFNYYTFGNKALTYFLTYVILKYFPFWLWKLKDGFANLIYNRPLHIIAIYKKLGK
jgi:ubiquinone/menaquinone biosynthesis C-methylase UbiE